MNDGRKVRSETDNEIKVERIKRMSRVTYEGH